MKLVEVKSKVIVVNSVEEDAVALRDVGKTEHNQTRGMQT
jgi:hypothetical protein